MSTGFRGGKLAGAALQDEVPYLQPPKGCSHEYRRLWRSVVEDFPPDRFRESDRGVLETYIGTLERLRETEAALAGEPMIIENRLGSPIKNPLFDMVEAMTRSSLAQARALKLVPSARENTRSVPQQSEHRRRQGEEAAAAKRPGGIRLAS